MITSPSNPKLRYVRNLARRSFRRREGRMLLEGSRLVASALEAGVAPAFVLLGEPAGDPVAFAALLERLAARQVPLLEVSPPLFAELADTASPQGILAVVPADPPPWPDDPTLLLVLDGVQEPGNVGTMLRSALAAGADGVLLAPGTADATQAKAVRAGMGAHFRLPWRATGWAGVDATLGELPLWLAEADGELPYTELDWTAPLALAIGGEASGASAEARQRAVGSVRIPMPGQAESLNAAMAATVLLFEAARQRGS